MNLFAVCRNCGGELKFYWKPAYTDDTSIEISVSPCEQCHADVSEDLLEACKAVRTDILDKPTSYIRIETLKQVQAAIQKAEGEK